MLPAWVLVLCEHYFTESLDHPGICLLLLETDSKLASELGTKSMSPPRL